jgi:hypothetical protein
MPKPNYLLIGAAKCGTTSFCALLAQHPDVFMHPQKELNFFAFDRIYDRGWSWYEECFHGAEGKIAIGEGSPNYTKHGKHPAAVERIARHLPAARLIYLVRHPLQRMESAWLHARRAGHESYPSFTETVRRRPEYLATSDYLAQTEAYRAHFPDERLLVLFLEDFRVDPRGVMGTTFRFLGVDDTFEVQDTERAHNVSLRHTVDSPLLKRLQRVPAFRMLERHVPEGWRRLERRVVSHELTERPRWDEETLDHVRDRLSEPIRRFLIRYGKAPGFWVL